jgi:uncharacterized protein (DUF305 family)
VAGDHGADFQKMKAAMDELAQKTGQDFEIAYINSIILHHQDAIEMARSVQMDAPHQEVRDIATKIINDQQGEIDELTKHLQDWYDQPPSPDLRMKMSPSMMEILMQADATMREKHFLAMMREHHQMAFDIGQLVLQKATHTELKEQAQRMIASQREEQAIFGGWLQGLYGIAPPAPTGDMQHGMEAAMQMPMAPAASSGPAAPSAAPQALPNTSGESQQFVWFLLTAGIVALLMGSYMLRRSAA